MATGKEDSASVAVIDLTDEEDASITVDVGSKRRAIDVTDRTSYRQSLAAIAAAATQKPPVRRKRPLSSILVIEYSPSQLSFPLPRSLKLMPPTAVTIKADHFSRLPTVLIQLTLSWLDGAQSFMSMHCLSRCFYCTILQQRHTHASNTYDFTPFHRTVTSRSFDQCMKSARSESVALVNLRNCDRVDGSVIASNISECVNVSVLDLSLTQVAPTHVRAIARHCQQLRDLRLQSIKPLTVNTDETHSMLNGLLSLESLRMLDLSDCAINDSDLHNLRIDRTRSYLFTHLSLSRNRVGVNGLWQLLPLLTHSLVYLDLSHCELLIHSRSCLAECRSLRYLNLSYQRTPPGTPLTHADMTREIGQVLAGCTVLQCLNVSGNPLDPMMLALGADCERPMRHLLLNDCQATGRVLHSLMQRFPALRKLEIASSSINDNDLIEWCELLTREKRSLYQALESLNVSHCIDVTNAGCEALIATLKGLKVLNVHDCHYVNVDRLREQAARANRGTLPSPLDVGRRCDERATLTIVQSNWAAHASINRMREFP